MSSFPGSPRLVRGGIVAVDPASGRLLRTIGLQYNPDTVTRTVQPQGIGAEPGDRLEALRLKGPAHETIKLEAEFDATDQLEFPQANRTVAENGLHPQLAALQLLVQPSSASLLANDRSASLGTIEVAPLEAPLTLFVWGRKRVLPVRLTELTVTEEAFDTMLNPIRARANLGLRVLTVDDLGFGHRGGALYLVHHQQQERLAALRADSPLAALGLSGLPGA
jgi:hypothetical protein